MNFHFQMVIEQAKKFTVHGRRKRVIAEDIDSAFTMCGYPVLIFVIFFELKKLCTF